MGSSVSTLSPEQSAIVTQKLKDKYAAGQAEHLSDADLQAKLTEEYGKLVHSFASKGGKATPTHAKSDHAAKNAAGGDNLTNIVHKRLDGHDKNAKSKPADMRRKRSFDNNASDKAIHKALLKATSMDNAVVAGPALIPEGEHEDEHLEADSWDSVTHQPYCNICHMAFKSEGFLKRHINFSDFHKDNDARARGIELPSKTTTTAGTEEPLITSQSAPVLPAKPIAPEPVEGIDYKLLYTGSKFFWRKKETIDVHIFHHVTSDTIEIIGYDLTFNKEMNRLYLNYDTFLTMIEKHPNHAGFTRTDKETDEEEDRKERRKTIVTCFLQRIQLTPSNTPGAGVTSGNVISFVRLAADGDVQPLLESKPDSIIPMVVKDRKRRSNMEEIETTMRNLNVDREAMVDATKHAEDVEKAHFSH